MTFNDIDKMTFKEEAGNTFFVEPKPTVRVSIGWNSLF